MFGLNVIEMIFVAGFGTGGCVVFLVCLFGFIRPTMKAFQRLRYEGFRPESPIPQRPKTVPGPKLPNEAF